ncbi:dipeptidase PepV [Streptococcus iniae]|uniref:dipeptidase PepV n=1 Tax=Streptococcus iniae TaxID=1346 RepID=UPI002B301D0C|nr:dipeptidase PepV [Streptococcus iniae]WNZ92977.1 dipeptidase PepV [Streptococcus iniae]WNZ94204.1 dipeptidase PepV [Streptococcus iniae]WNZ95956.1 dipeptidase PepV [Streptococcus iniae]
MTENWYQEVLLRKEDLLADVERLLVIPSVREDHLASKECPVGPGPKQALDEFLKMSEEAGFAQESFGNIVAHLDWGQGEDLFGVMGHLDVVPVGDGWESDPFTPTYRDGKLFARGALDDKGPLVATFFAMKLLKEKGFIPKKKVRLIVGTDEESDWKCLNYYQSICPIPKIGFVPDAYFPIVNGEKGNGSVVFEWQCQKDEKAAVTLESFEAGRRENMVADRAEAEISGQGLVAIARSFEDFVASYDFLQGQVSWSQNKLILQLKGKSAHGSKPEAGHNAATYLATFLSGYSFWGPYAQEFLTVLGKDLHLDYFGQGFGLAYSDPQMGQMTLNPGIISYKAQDVAHIRINLRYPKGFDVSVARDLLVKGYSTSLCNVFIEEKQKPHYVSEEHPMVQSLLKIYHEQTKLPAYERVIGGATYARLMPEGVAFGALFPEAVDTMHQANEHIVVEDLLKATAMYARAFVDLVC